MAEEQVLQEEFQSRVSAGKDWKEIVAWVGDLPPLPHVAAQALALIEDPDTTAQKLTELLGGDTALAARVLKIANSAMFSRQREITTINQAIMTIGFKTLKGIIVAATLRQLNRKFGKIEQMLWENSTCTAIAARHVTAKLKRPYAEESFLLGLLHDLGKLVLMRQVSKEYEGLVQKTQQGAFFVDLEQQDFGFAHTLIGALVAKKWNFSLETCQVILHHHDKIKDAPRSDLDEKTAIIQCADYIAHALNCGHLEGYPDCRPLAIASAQKLGFAEADAVKLIEEIGQAYKDGGAAFM
ncbi:MAG: HDOD domain-containing protein [Bdellovibrionota bacterium]